MRNLICGKSNGVGGLSSNVQFLKGVGPRRARLLGKIGIFTIDDLLKFFPYRYFDRERIRNIRDLEIGREETIEGIVKDWEEKEFYKGKRRIYVSKAIVADKTGSIPVVWFGKRYLNRAIKIGDKIIVSGTVKGFILQEMMATDFEVQTTDDYVPIHTKRIVPVYHLVNGISSRYLRRIIWDAINSSPKMVDIIPPEFLKKNCLMNVTDAIRNIHFPRSLNAFYLARKRFAYEEFFLMQMFLSLKRKWISSKTSYKIPIGKELDFRIRRLFPFELTRAQERVIGEIASDISSGKPMNRLLQGDVGSGKTIVMLYALLAVIGNHLQAAVMVPTELLAEQHYSTITKLMCLSRVRVCLLTSNLTSNERTKTLKAIKDGEIDLVIGTHSLIQKAVEFKNLALVVIDEQHRFGVTQRAQFRAKGLNPHTLVMTATPIPRTLSLTLFGDLDVSVIDELPPGRKSITTILKPASQIRECFDFIREKLHQGRQAYFVYPLIDESDKLPLKSAAKMSNILKEEFKDFNVALLHSGIAKREREFIMAKFRDGTINILVSTIVIEVGIDVPNATIMVIENAQRYGLAQLHQLRGRIGRGCEASYCFLFGEPSTAEAKRRLEIMTETTDGFKIAQEDLRLRGPGEFFGTRQSGLPELKVADIIRDFTLLREARRDAFALVFNQSPLSSKKIILIKDVLRQRYKDRLDLVSVG